MSETKEGAGGDRHIRYYPDYTAWEFELGSTHITSTQLENIYLVNLKPSILFMTDEMKQSRDLPAVVRSPSEAFSISTLRSISVPLQVGITLQGRWEGWLQNNQNCLVFKMPRRAKLQFLSLRSSLVNLPISLYGQLVEQGSVSIRYNLYLLR